MRIFARANGELIAAIRGIDVGAPATGSPLFATGATAMLDVDDETNEALATALESGLAPFRLNAGVLTRNGQPVTIAPPGRFFQDQSQVQQAAAQIDALIDASNAGNLTTNQQQQALKILLRVARYVLRWVARRG